MSLIDLAIQLFQAEEDRKHQIAEQQRVQAELQAAQNQAAQQAQQQVAEIAKEAELANLEAQKAIQSAEEQAQQQAQQAQLAEQQAKVLTVKLEEAGNTVAKLKVDLRTEQEKLADCEATRKTQTLLMIASTGATIVYFLIKKK